MTVGSLQWFGPADPNDRRHLMNACDAIGPPAVVEAARAAPQELRRIVFVSWNMHEGRGDLTRLVDDLHAEAAVLLVQEAVRGIRTIAESRGWSAIYVPSMMNGPKGRAQALETADRGCAIVSTLPLSNPIAIELPWVYQRRVAVAATVTAVKDGEPLAL